MEQRDTTAGVGGRTNDVRVAPGVPILRCYVNGRQLRLASGEHRISFVIADGDTLTTSLVVREYNSVAVSAVAREVRARSESD